MTEETRQVRKSYRFAKVDMLIATAVVSSLVFIWLIAVPAFSPQGIAKHSDHLSMLSSHVFGGTFMLLSGAIGLRIGVTRQWFRWHKPTGYVYLASGCVASVTALIRSFDSAHTPGLSTGTLAAVWLAFSAMAFRAIRNRQFEQHRSWMIRSYILAWTFVFCRFWTRAAPAGLQGSEIDMIWFTWIVPVLFAEICLQWKAGAARA